MKTPRRRSRYELIPVTCSVCGKLWRIVTGPGDAPLPGFEDDLATVAQDSGQFARPTTSAGTGG